MAAGAPRRSPWRMSTRRSAATRISSGVDGGVFETDAPGALMDVAAHPSWLDSLGSREWTVDRALVNGADDGAVRGAARQAHGEPLRRFALRDLRPARCGRRASWASAGARPAAWASTSNVA